MASEGKFFYSTYAMQEVYHAYLSSILDESLNECERER